MNSNTQNKLRKPLILVKTKIEQIREKYLTEKTMCHTQNIYAVKKKLQGSIKNMPHFHLSNIVKSYPILFFETPCIHTRI